MNYGCLAAIVCIIKSQIKIKRMKKIGEKNENVKASKGNVTVPRNLCRDKHDASAKRQV